MADSHTAIFAVLAVPRMTRSPDVGGADGVDGLTTEGIEAE
jgi:hypothetical protein